jgi:hypothetical protein
MTRPPPIMAGTPKTIMMPISLARSISRSSLLSPSESESMVLLMTFLLADQVKKSTDAAIVKNDDQ